METSTSKGRSLPLTRRALVTTGAAALAVAKVPARAQSPFVRYSIYPAPLQPTTPSPVVLCHPIVADYANGVNNMKTTSKNNPTYPTGWFFQAAIHGTVSTTANPAWNQCQHRSFFFLSWHRMYLYWFERIIRKASGSSTFALPYWNYSATTPNAAVLPLPFRDPQSPLYTPQRGTPPVAGVDTGINAGVPLPASAVAFQQSMTPTQFIGSPNGFGGGAITSPIQVNSAEGTIEHQPHDMVHSTMGGLMGVIEQSALDPIFYLHHANIDRLWTQWIGMGGGRADPTSGNWLTQSFTFFDENMNQQSMTAQNILDTVANLDYRYDDQPGLVPILSTGESCVVRPIPTPVGQFVAEQISDADGR